MWGVLGILLVCLGCGRVQFDLLSDAGGDSLTTDATDAPSPDARSDWWDAGWNRRIKLIVDNTTGPELSGFPLLVKMNASRISYGDALPTGADLRFVADDQETLLPFDIERWGSGDSFVWVRADLPATGTLIFYLYYGNPNASSASSAFSTWGNYSLVWHMAQIPTGTANDIADSSPNNNRGTTSGMPAGAQATDIVGGSLGFDGTDDWITAPNSASLMLPSSLTIQMWINIATARNQWLCDFVDPVTEQETGNHLYELAINGSDELELQWEYGAGNDDDAQSTASIAATPGTWALIGVTRNATSQTVTFYENGAVVGTPLSYVNNATGGSASNFYVAGYMDNTSSKLPFAGRIDEVRIFDDWRTPAWMSADYRSMTDALINYGLPQSY